MKQLKLIISCVLALVFCAIICIGILITTRVGGQIVDSTSQLQVEEVLSQGIQLERKVIPASSFAEEGINSQATSVQTITATITPDNSGLQRLNWSLDWTQANEWVNQDSKSVSDYIKMEVSADTKTVTLECLQAFGAQIKLTATVKTNTSVKAECTIDYLSRIIHANCHFGAYEMTGETISHIYDFSCPTAFDTLEPTVILSDYTIKNDEKTFSISVAPNTDLFTTNYFNTTEIYNEWVLGYLPGSACDILSWTFKNGQKASEMTSSEIYDIMDSWEIGTKLYTVTISWTMSGESGSVSTDILFGGVTDSGVANNVNLNNSNIIF